MMSRIDRWIFEEYPARVADLAICRIIYSVYFLLTFFPRASWTIGMPSTLYSPPPGPIAMFDDWPSPWLIYGLNGLLLVSAVALLIGWRTVIASLLTGTLCLLLNCWHYAAGKIDHTILIALTPLALAASGWGRWLSVDAWKVDGSPEEPARGWCLTLLALLISVAMATAGWAKLANGWLDPATPSTFGYLTTHYVREGGGPLAGLAIRFFPTWIFLRELPDWFVVGMELGFLLAMARRSVFLGFLAVAMIFHLKTWLFFGITFTPNLVAYAAFVSWSRLVPVPLRSPRRAAWAVVGIAALACGLLAFRIGPFFVIGTESHGVILIFGSVIAVGYLIRSLSGYVRPRSGSLRAAPSSHVMN